MPKVSIITPTFNRADTLPRAVESVLAQTETDWEHIIVDDGSTDNTKEIVESFKDKRIVYLCQENAGPSTARNNGITHATSKWIMYLDSDDELFENCIETMLEHLEANSEYVFGFPRGERTQELYENGKLVKTIDDSGDTPESFTVQDIFNRNAGFACNGFTHLHSLFNEGIRWDKDLARMEDWELMLQIAEKYPEGFCYVPIVLQKYRQKYGMDNLVSQSTFSTWADAFEYIYKKHADTSFMKDQTWYPAKVEKWRKLQAQFEAGEISDYNHYYFER